MLRPRPQCRMIVPLSGCSLQCLRPVSPQVQRKSAHPKVKCAGGPQFVLGPKSMRGGSNVDDFSHNWARSQMDQKTNRQALTATCVRTSTLSRAAAPTSANTPTRRGERDVEAARAKEERQRTTERRQSRGNGNLKIVQQPCKLRLSCRASPKNLERTRRAIPSMTSHEGQTLHTEAEGTDTLCSTSDGRPRDMPLPFRESDALGEHPCIRRRT